MNDDVPFSFGTVAIVGVGLLGGSLGMVLRARKLAARVVGVGRDVEKLNRAVSLGAIDAATTEWEAGVADADLVVLCTSVSHIIETLAETMRAAKSGAVVTDVGSVKGVIVAAAANAPFFVGGHPMAGSEQTGVEAATPGLFQNATWAVTPTPDTDPQAVRLVEALARAVGARPLTLTPDAHDAVVAVTSHLPHVLAAALMRRAQFSQSIQPQTSRMTAGSFADMTRIAASSPTLWRDICLANRPALLSALRAFQGDLNVLAQAVQDGDGAQVEAFFAEGADAKRRWNVPV